MPKVRRLTPVPGACQGASAVTPKKKTKKKASASSAKAKKPSAGKPASKKPSSKKPAGKKPAAKKPSSKKPASKKSVGSKKKSSAGKASAVKTSTVKVGSKKKKTSSAKSTTKKTSAKKASAKKAVEKKSSKKKAAKKAAVAVKVVDAPAGKKVSGKALDAKKVETKTDAKTGNGLKPARLRSQPVEVQEIDQRVVRERTGRIQPFTPRSYGNKPKKPSAKDIVDLLSKHMGKAPPLTEKQMPATVVELGIFCIFALGGNSARASLDATNRLTKRFPVWNEFRVSEAYEFLEVLEGVNLVEVYDHCEQVLEFVNEIYKDQNEVDLEFLKEMSPEDRLVALNRYRSLGPALSHYMALALQGFEGVLFHYSWSRAIQRVGIVERTGSPKKLSAAIEKSFKGLDTVSLQVDLIDLGEEVCLPKAPNCRNCYLVLHCKSRKI